MLRKTANKIRERRGFTLAESLIAVLILLMVSLIVATGMPAAAQAYDKAVLGANAQAMLTTAASSLRDELGLATEVKVSGTDITYRNPRTGASAKLSLDTGKGIMVQEFAQAEDALEDVTLQTGTARRLVSDKAATSGMIVTYTSVAKDANGVLTFTGLTVKKGDKEMVKLEKPLVIRPAGLEA